MGQTHNQGTVSGNFKFENVERKLFWNILNEKFKITFTSLKCFTPTLIEQPHYTRRVGEKKEPYVIKPSTFLNIF